MFYYVERSVRVQLVSNVLEKTFEAIRGKNKLLFFNLIVRNDLRGTNLLILQDQRGGGFSLVKINDAWRWFKGVIFVWSIESG